eukprot:COSAG01_NODE_55_length_31115_cov_105.202533_14_plen_116_part_00
MDNPKLLQSILEALLEELGCKSPGADVMLTSPSISPLSNAPPISLPAACALSTEYSVRVWVPDRGPKKPVDEILPQLKTQTRRRLDSTVRAAPTTCPCTRRPRAVSCRWQGKGTL